MPIDRARRRGVRRPAFFDNKQQRDRVAAGFGVHDPNDPVLVVEKLDPVLHFERA